MKWNQSQSRLIENVLKRIFFIQHMSKRTSFVSLITLIHKLRTEKSIEGYFNNIEKDRRKNVSQQTNMQTLKNNRKIERKNLCMNFCWKDNGDKQRRKKKIYDLAFFIFLILLRYRKQQQWISAGRLIN